MDIAEEFVASANQVAFMAVFAKRYACAAASVQANPFDIDVLCGAIGPDFMLLCFEELPGIYNQLIADPRLASDLPWTIDSDSSCLNAEQNKILSEDQKVLVETAERYSTFLTNSLLAVISFDHFVYLANTAHSLLDHFEQAIAQEQQLPVQMLLMMYRAKTKLKSVIRTAKRNFVDSAQDLMLHTKFYIPDQVYSTSYYDQFSYSTFGSARVVHQILSVGHRNFFACFLATYSHTRNVNFAMPEMLTLAVRPVEELYQELSGPEATIVAIVSLRTTLGGDVSDTPPRISDAVAQAIFDASLAELTTGVPRYGVDEDESMLRPPVLFDRVRDLTNDYAAGSRTLFCCCLLGQDRGIYNTPESLNASRIRTMMDKLEELNDDVDCYFSEYEQTFENYRRFVDFVPGGRSEVKQVTGALMVTAAAAIVAVTTFTLLVTAPPLFAILAAAAAASALAGGMVATGTGLYFLGQRRSGLSKAMAEFHDEARSHIDDPSQIPSLTRDTL